MQKTLTPAQTSVLCQVYQLLIDLPQLVERV